MILELQHCLVSVVMNSMLFTIVLIQNLKMKASNVLKKASVLINLEESQNRVSNLTKFSSNLKMVDVHQKIKSAAEKMKNRKKNSQKWKHAKNMKAFLH